MQDDRVEGIDPVGHRIEVHLAGIGSTDQAV
jgi:hypothetical protein